jgi:hypothetical protein
MRVYDETCGHSCPVSRPSCEPAAASVAAPGPGTTEVELIAHLKREEPVLNQPSGLMDNALPRRRRSGGACGVYVVPRGVGDVMAVMPGGDEGVRVGYVGSRGRGHDSAEGRCGQGVGRYAAPLQCLDREREAVPAAVALRAEAPREEDGPHGGEVVYHGAGLQGEGAAGAALRKTRQAAKDSPVRARRAQGFWVEERKGRGATWSDDAGVRSDDPRRRRPVRRVVAARGSRLVRGVVVHGTGCG